MSCKYKLEISTLLLSTMKGRLLLSNLVIIPYFSALDLVEFVKLFVGPCARGLTRGERGSYASQKNSSV